MPRWVIPGLFLVLCIAAYAKDNDGDLTGLTIEQLFQVEVTSASRMDHKLSDTAAAVFVITQEDIRRSTATSIPELLRMVPGLSVARLTGNTWAITARGFNTQYAGKLLVMVDGRTVYDPTFSGVFWNIQGYLLEDIDHIEVIRGPGASVWGTNAVNGIINILTKSAENTVGSLVTASGGNEERGTVAARYGARFGHNTYYRIYSKFFNRGSSFSPGGVPVQDDWQQFRSGLRVDSVIDSRNSVMVQAEGYTDTTQQPLPALSYMPLQLSYAIGDFTLAGGHFLTRWKHKSASGAEMQLQGYYSLLDVDVPSIFERRHTGDIDFQHKPFTSGHHNLLWGAGYRFTTASLLSQPDSFLKFDSPRATKHYASLFAQDEIRLAADRLHL
ncbi:MAG TPA: TonB-dependent receptor plug domain-containing protein, partial [Terriglobales bacterium]|nr:TonB-dependent receptor plug domain-containing protein [Terriglobales bacterium]